MMDQSAAFLEEIGVVHESRVGFALGVGDYKEFDKKEG
jgi:hypothetical protein